MTEDLHAPVVRRIARALALTPAVLVSLAAAPALAVAPDSWPQPDKVSTLHVLVLLAGVPLGLFVLITLLVYVPSAARGQRYQPGLAWRNENEWFGGPTDGLEAADKTEPAAVEAAEHDRGGASARW